MNKVKFIIPELLSFLLLPFRKWGERWDRIMSELAEEIKKEAEREARRPKHPGECYRCGNSRFNHGRWNSGIHAGNAIGRSGWRCWDCGCMVWDRTDEQFIVNLEERAPHVLLDCNNIPDEYLPFVSTELLEKRVRRISNNKAHDLIREKERVTERLAELEELESKGAMKIKAA